MRSFAAALAMALLVACSTTPVPRSQSPEVSADIPVAYLVSAAATDFHASKQVHPARFRAVRIGHVANGDGAMQYMLCGQFLPAEATGSADWIPFVTIKTSGYEQYLGTQAASLCQRSSVVWDRNADLTSLLQAQLDSLR